MAKNNIYAYQKQLQATTDCVYSLDVVCLPNPCIVSLWERFFIQAYFAFEVGLSTFENNYLLRPIFSLITSY